MISSSRTGRSIRTSYSRNSPSGLRLDVWDDHAWLGVVPFQMTNASARPAGDGVGIGVSRA